MDYTRKQSYRHVDIRVAMTCAGLIGLPLPALSFANGGRVTQKGKPGEIVLTGNVATRPIDRAGHGLDGQRIAQPAARQQHAKQQLRHGCFQLVMV